MTWIDDVSALLGPYDTADLLKGLGALQLMPVNAERLFRLEAAAGIVSANPPAATGNRMSSHRWRQWLNQPPFAHAYLVAQEDPAEDVLCKEILFFGGSYRVMPGLVTDGAEIVKHLCTAIYFVNPRSWEPEYSKASHDLILATLRLSNWIAQTSGIERGALSTSTTREVKVPSAAEFNALKEAVVVTPPQLEEILAGLDPQALEPLVIEQGSASISEDVPWESSLYARPIVRLGDDLLVALPCALMAALRHALIVSAKQRGVVEDLGLRLREAVQQETIDSLQLLRCTPLTASLLSPHSDRFEEMLFAFDTDKALRLHLTTDLLGDYEEDEVYGKWSDDSIWTAFEERSLDVERTLFQSERPPNEIFHLLVTQGVGRWTVGGLGERPPPVRSHRLILNATSLRQIAMLESKDPLVLWKFAIASDRIRDIAHVFQTDVLDEFETYRSRHYSYYMSDEEAPTALMIAAGTGAALRERFHEHFDEHGVLTPEGRGIIEVVLAHGTQEVPIYFPPDDLTRPQLRLEVHPPIWVVGPTRRDRADLNRLCTLLTEAIAYWTWQIALHADESLFLGAVGDDRQLRIEFDIEESDAWFAASKPSNEGTIETSSEAGTIRLFFRSDMARMFSRVDNLAERLLVRKILNALKDFHPEESGPDLDGIIDASAPLGRKKHLLLLHADNRPELESGPGLPNDRGIQPPDEAWVLDELGQALRSAGRTTGDIPDSKRGTVLNEAVEFAFQSVVAKGRTLSSRGLLEWLISHNEALLQAQAQRELTIPTRLECYMTITAIEEELLEALPRTTTSAVVNRFLIEYFTSQPPEGLRPISLTAYDSLMAYAEEILTKGMMSDAVRFGMADHKLSILPSGRLGIDRDGNYETGRTKFLPVYARSEIHRSVDAFDRHWKQSGDNMDQPPGVDDLNAATEEEFGLSLTDLLAFLIEVFNEGRELHGQVKKRDQEELLTRLKARLSWSEDKLGRALELFSLGPRPDFLVPPPPFSNSDVYPWRFNRALSYIRRPLLKRHRGDRIEVLWGNRHVFVVSRNLVSLCVGGRLKARSAKMRKFLGNLRNQEGEEFNDAVADIYRQLPGLTVRTRVDKIGRHRITRVSGHDLGDIDVLVADESARVLLLIETKNLSLARTPAEMANELRTTFGTRQTSSTSAERHLERAEWIRDHRQAVLEWMGLDATRWADWETRPVIVVDSETMSPYVTDCPLPVLTVRDISTNPYLAIRGS
jgi:hypothetical protein